MKLKSRNVTHPELRASAASTSPLHTSRKGAKKLNRFRIMS